MEVRHWVEQGRGDVEQRRLDGEEELRLKKELDLIRDRGDRRGEAGVSGVARADAGALAFMQ